MLIYLFTFIISLIFLKISLILKKKNKILSYFFLLIGIGAPCLLAALRDETIGIDVLVYQKPHFLLAKNFPNFFDYMIRLNSQEYLYYFVTWIAANVFDNLGILFFSIEFLIILPLYISFNKIKKNDNDVIIGMYMFYFLWYDQTYNMARQSIAISFCILALVLFEGNHKKASILLILVAALFHNSAIIMYVILLLLSVMRGNSKVFKKIMYIAIILCITIVIMLNFSNILKILSLNVSTDYGFDKYINYVNLYGESKLMWKQLLMWIFYLIITIVFSKNIKSYTNNYYFYLLSLIISIFGFFAATIVSFSNRIFLYFSYPFLYIILARLPNSMKNKTNKMLLLFAILGLCFAFWLSSYVIGNGNHTMPYKFA